MRHSINIMFSEAFKEASLDLHVYVLNYGDSQVQPYFSNYICSKQDKSLCISKITHNVNEELENEIFIDSKNCFVSDATKKEVSITNFFSQLYRSTINIENRGDYNELLISMYIPLYDNEIWPIAKELIDIINKGNIPAQIDLIGLNGDIAPILCNNQDNSNILPIQEYGDIAKKNIEQIISYKNSNLEYINHFFVIQNAQKDGISLNLNRVSFTRIIGEFTLACIESYHNLIDFNISEKDFYTFGLSMISLDKYYFIQYLLANVYLHTMDKERIMQDSVDVNMTYGKTKELIEKWQHIMSDLYDSEIKPRIKDGKDHTTIIVEINNIISKKYEEIESDMKSFIPDSKLSIPEKKSILAALLGEDDELFKNITFDKNRLVIHDIENEALSLFTSQNNLLIATKGDTPDFSNYASLSENDESVVAPLKQIKDTRLEIQESASTIRRLEDENKKLEKQQQISEEAKKVLIQNGYFEYGDDKFKLLPDDDLGEPLENDYIPHKPKHNEIDLRENFTPIKNQGQQGSCLAHAATSLFEYMLKSNSDPNPDLSEAFLYYNAREKDGMQNNDNGSRIDYAMQSLVEYGICTEAMCKYDPAIYNIKPSEAAYKDAESKKVKEALNVDRNIDAIKSAIEDGYPVGITVRLTETFGSGNKGFVQVPSAAEIKEMQSPDYEGKKHSLHAMVICGYSDSYKFFIVRNSWGTSFGDNGYCYMPYTYFESDELFLCAYIIKEISCYKSIIINNDAFNLHLNTRDIAIKFAINKLQLENELSNLNKLETRYTELQIAYESLKAKIKLSNVQSSVIKGSEERLKEEIKQMSSVRNAKIIERREILENNSKATQRIQITLILSIVSLLIIGGLLYYWETFTLPTILYIIAGVLLCCSLAYIPVSKAHRRKLKEQLDDEINNIASKIDELTKEYETIGIRLYIAGSLLIKQFNLCDKIQNLYMSAISFSNNLKTWYKEVEESSKSMNSDSQPPFISILNNEVLQKYMDDNIDEITKDIHISNFLLTHNVSEVGITQLKVSIKQTVINSITDILRDFSIFKYVTKREEYSFLPPVDLDIIEKMDSRSSFFLTCNNSGGALNPHKLFMLNYPNSTDGKWKNEITKSFSNTPSLCNIDTNNKILLFLIQDLNLDQLS